MSYYIVNNQKNDGQYNEVHAHTCAYLPHPDNSTPIGEFLNCHDAVDKAASLGFNPDGCMHCCTPCHNG
ncbi:hypothetical protein [Alloalcanivorax xenomutans]